MKRKCGYVAILGQPNAGKSTLMNALVGAKISAVSHKPQTTREEIKGILTEDDCQIILLDTPGLLRTGRYRQAERALVSAADGAMASADVLIYLIDAGIQPIDRDLAAIRKIVHELPKHQKNFYIYISKTDRVTKERLELKKSQISEAIDAEKFEAFCSFTHLHLVSAKQKGSIFSLKERLKEKMPMSDFHFDEDDLTDRSTSKVTSDLIREATFRCLGDELPYRMDVSVTDFFERPEKNMVAIKAKILVRHQNHKGIVIGKGGCKIKEIGILARQNIEKFLGKKAHLELICTHNAHNH